MTETDWNQLEAALQALECDVSPAGAHGQLTALGCRVEAAPPDLGLAANGEDAVAWGQVQELRQQTAQQLAGHDLGFSPLLPPDDEPLQRRLEALSEWAECFAFGLSLPGAFEPKNLSHDGRECLEHVLDITRLDPLDDEAQGPEAEEAYTELVEFLRIAVMTLYVEFHNLEQSPSHSVH